MIIILLVALLNSIFSIILEWFVDLNIICYLQININGL